MLRALLSKLLDRVTVIIAGAVASRVETLVVLDEADRQDELEEFARRLDGQDKPHLAHRLRQTAARISRQAPAASALPAMEHLGGDTGHDDALAPDSHGAPAALPNPDDAETRTRRPKRRTKSAEE